MSGPIPIGVVQSIVDLTAAGMSTKHIAARLGISTRTVVRWRAKTTTPGAPAPEPISDTPPTVWQQHAACRSEDPAWFVLADDDAPTGYGRGRAVCMRCPVRDACLDDALTREGDAAAEDRAGLWGGLSPQQRANLTAVRTPRTAAVPTRTEEIAARRRADLLAALQETA